jgi:hypothetical protein
VVSTGKQVAADISTTGVKAGPFLDLSKWEQAEGARSFRPLIRKAEKIIAAGNDMGGDIGLLVRRLKEALLLKNKDQAEDLRDELQIMFDAIERVEKLL